MAPTDDFGMTAKELAAALKGRSSSISTDKVIAVMAGLINVPWDRIKMFKLDWKVETLNHDDIVLPVIHIMAHDGTSVDVPGLDRVES